MRIKNIVLEVKTKEGDEFRKDATTEDLNTILESILNRDSSYVELYNGCVFRKTNVKSIKLFTRG